jgi:hypothetical protein
MVHFYHDLTEQEMYAICAREIDDVLAVRDGFLKWRKNHPEFIDTPL